VSRNDAWAIDSGVRVAIGGRVYVSFERTRRLAADDTPRAPSSYGAAPIAAWDSGHDADLIVPVREDEAVWLGLSSAQEEMPCAVRVIVREPIAVDAATGSAPAAGLSDTPQNYLIVPPQHAVTGVTAGEGIARQFVRVSRSNCDAPCRRLQLIVYAPSHHVVARRSSPLPLLHQPAHDHAHQRADGKGLVLQRIVADPHGLDIWRGVPSISVDVELVAPEIYAGHTGRAAPGPLTDDTKYGGWRLP
jgi:hypothetical protein